MMFYSAYKYLFGDGSKCLYLPINVIFKIGAFMNTIYLTYHFRLQFEIVIHDYRVASIDCSKLYGVRVSSPVQPTPGKRPLAAVELKAHSQWQEAQF